MKKLNFLINAKLHRAHLKQCNCLIVSALPWSELERVYRAPDSVWEIPQQGRYENTFWANSVHICLGSPQVAQLSIFHEFISKVGPPLGTCF